MTLSIWLKAVWDGMPRERLISAKVLPSSRARTPHAAVPGSD